MRLTQNVSVKRRTGIREHGLALMVRSGLSVVFGVCSVEEALLRHLGCK